MPMTPVDMTSACSGLHADRLGRPGGHLPGVGVALVAGAGVGDAGVDGHDANRVARRSLAVELHRRGAHQILACTRPRRRRADR